MSLTLLDMLVILSCVCFVETALLIYVPFRYFKPLARKINKAIKKGWDLLFLLYDDGRVYVKEVTQIAKHGVLKGKGKDEYFILTAPSPEKKTDVDKDLKELLIKRAILEDTGSCALFGYAGLVTVSTPFVAGAVELTSNPGLMDADVPEEHRGKKPVILFDLNKLKDALAAYSGMTAADLAAILHDNELRIIASMGKGRFGSLMWFTAVLIGIFVVAIALRILGIGG